MISVPLASILYLFKVDSKFTSLHCHCIAPSLGLARNEQDKLAVLPTLTIVFSGGTSKTGGPKQQRKILLKELLLP